MSLGELAIIRDAVTLLRENLEEVVACVLREDGSIPAITFTLGPPDFLTDIELSPDFKPRKRSNALQVFIEDSNQAEQFENVSGPVIEDQTLIIRWWVGNRQQDVQHQRRLIAGAALKLLMRKHWFYGQESRSWLRSMRINYGSETMREDSATAPTRAGRRNAEIIDYAQVRADIPQRVTTI
jgi:hypothetical protein